MSNRRSRSTRISLPAPAQENTQMLDQTLRDGLNHNLKARSTGLAHHNKAYWFAMCVCVWLMCLIYGPLTYIALKVCVMLYRDELGALKELADIFLQKEGGIIVAVLCVIPIYLLSGLLKYNRIDASQDTGEGDNVFSPFLPSP